MAIKSDFKDKIIIEYDEPGHTLSRFSAPIRFPLNKLNFKVTSPYQVVYRCPITNVDSLSAEILLRAIEKVHDDQTKK